jgi:hypothetical protein
MASLMGCVSHSRAPTDTLSLSLSSFVSGGVRRLIRPLPVAGFIDLGGDNGSSVRTRAMIVLGLKPGGAPPVAGGCDNSGTLPLSATIDGGNFFALREEILRTDLPCRPPLGLSSLELMSLATDGAPNLNLVFFLLLSDGVTEAETTHFGLQACGARRW